MDMTKYAGSESRWLKASDLAGQRPRVTIKSVSLLEFDDEEKGKITKPAVTFEGKEKGMVFNATSVEEMIRAFGINSDDWIGKQIQLSTKYYKSFGKEGIIIMPIVDDEFDDKEILF